MSRAVANADSIDGMSSLSLPAVGGVRPPSRSLKRASSSSRIDAPRIAGGGIGVDDSVSVDVLKAEMKRCELAVLDELECRMRAHSKVAESARQTQGDACAMLLARIEKLEGRAKDHDELNLAVHFMYTNMQVAKKRQEELEESVQAIAAQMATITAQYQSTDALAQELEALHTKTSKAQEEQATIAQTQGKAVEALRAEASKTNKELQAPRTKTSKAQEEQATIAQTQGKAVEALRAEASQTKKEREALLAKYFMDLVVQKL